MLALGAYDTCGK